MLRRHRCEGRRLLAVCIIVCRVSAYTGMHMQQRSARGRIVSLNPLSSLRHIKPSQCPQIKTKGMSSAAIQKGGEEKKQASDLFLLQGLILSALVMQSAGVSLLTRYMCQKVQYSGAAVSFIQELVKFPLAFLVLVLSGQSKSVFSIFQRIAKPRELVQLCIPAGCFAAQNVLFFVAHERIPAILYLVLSQTKSIFTALFSIFLIPGKRLRVSQWLSQPVLVAGAVLVLLPQMSATSATRGSAAMTSFLVGVGAALFSALVSGFANVYFERLVKTDDKAFWPRQLQLAAATAVFTMFALPRGGLRELPTLLEAFTPGVWSIVLLKAIGGLLIGGTIVYTSAITKNFATATAIALTAILAGHPGGTFNLGLSMVFFSIFLYNYNFSKHSSRLKAKEAI